ncbi:MAG: ATP-dependent zinc metalloprotease FtsH [Candidatus Dependentiae bacterium]
MNKNKKNQLVPGGMKHILFGALFVLASIFLLSRLSDYARSIDVISYSDFLKRVEANDVKWVRVYGQEVKGLLNDGSAFETVVGNNPNDWDLLRKHNVEFSVVNPASQINMWYLAFFLGFLGLLIAIAWLFMRQARNSSGNSGSNIFTMGKSRARMLMPSSIKENFNSVAGAAEAKEELKDIVNFLKDPKKYSSLGAKIPRGVLLIGEPGNGKTLLAKAVAGEANCPFFSISGSDFIEVFVGVGASRVRDLFAQARKHSPSIIFIDEIDAVGRHRGSGLGGGHDEREQTLNQLLTEMDGFQTGEGAVIVLAATNRPDVLDKALLRPGRFDRRVTVPYPDINSREQILKVHAKGVKIDPAVDLHKIARATPGFSGADLANLINEAALLASKNNQSAVTVNDFEEARDKVMVGKANKSIVMTKEDLKMTAYHEAGHALLYVLLPENMPLHKVTVMPRGSALGITWGIPDRDKHTETKEECLSFIKMCLGGRLAELMIFGKLTSGAHNDYQQATQAARKMVCAYGMSENLGPVSYAIEGYHVSQRTAELIDEEIRRILKECEADARRLLEENIDKLHKLAEVLLEKETIPAEEVYELLGLEPRAIHSFV